MKEFSNASIPDFKDLDSILDDGMLHVYKNRMLPAGCSPDHARIGFEKQGNIYKLLIDSGIESDVDNDDFKFFISRGEVKFSSLDDMISFFRSLLPLFEASVTTESVVDRQKVNELTAVKRVRKEIWPGEISSALKREIYGQDGAIDALDEGIVMNLMSDEHVYVALFMGPPATGKTETASLLANVLTGLSGQEYGFIKVDANTYSQEHMIQNILGAPPSYIGYGRETVLEPIRKNPYHVVLFDEIDKANEKLLVALMGALDKGFLQLADNSPAIDLNKCIVLFTSNIPIDIDAYLAAGEWDRAEMCKNIFTDHCGRVEISRRIQDFMVFMPLMADAEIDIIVKFARKTLGRYGAELVHIDESLMADFLSSRTKYGSSEIANRVNKAINRAVLKSRNRKLLDKKKVALKGTPENIEIKIIDEEEDYGHDVDI